MTSLLDIEARLRLEDPAFSHYFVGRQQGRPTLHVYARTPRGRGLHKSACGLVFNDTFKALREAREGGRHTGSFCLKCLRALRTRKAL